MAATVSCVPPWTTLPGESIAVVSSPSRRRNVDRLAAMLRLSSVRDGVR